ncbi:unnamed protein product [Toxocara canis]|uniref:Uncharacterized protein n=1 Tax=Toxocara canis TaxID=6265 RepID=A0A183UX03_TOXCA|nr:unnamed protein product [Toxocara canis]
MVSTVSMDGSGQRGKLTKCEDEIREKGLCAVVEKLPKSDAGCAKTATHIGVNQPMVSFRNNDHHVHGEKDPSEST